MESFLIAFGVSFLYSKTMRLNTVLRNIIIGGIFILPFIPFIVSKSMFFPFITGKNFAFRIIVEIIFAGWIVLAWRDTGYRLKFSWVFAALTALVGVVAIADIFGEDFLRSFWSNYERMDGFITLLHLFLLFIVLGSVMNSKQMWVRFLQTSVGASVALSFYSILQLMGVFVINQGGVRVDATLGNATYLAGYILLHIFFTAFLFSQKNTPTWLQALYGAIIALHIFILFNTMTRGAILAFLGGTILVALLLVFLSDRAAVFKKYAIGVLAAIILLTGIFVAVKDTDFVRKNQILDRLAGISLKAGHSRFLVWGVAWEGVKEKPILGWGQDNFILAFSKHYNPRMYSEEPWFDRAHNIVLDWLIAGGALALLAYVSIYIALMYALWFFRRDDETEMSERGKRDSIPEPFSVSEKTIFTGLLAAYLFHNLFVFDNVVSYVFFFSVLAFIHYSSTQNLPSILRRLPRVTISAGGRESVERFLAPFVLIALIFSLYFLNVKSIQGNSALLNAINLRAAQGAASPEERESLLRNNLRSFQKSLSRGFLGKTETLEQLVQVTSNMAAAPVSQILKQEFFALAHSEMEKQIEKSPDNLRMRMFTSSLLIHYRLFDEAIIELEKARAVSDKKQDIHFLLANAYLGQGNLEKALEVGKFTYELEPNNDRAVKIYVALLIRASRVKEAEAILKERNREEFLTDPDIVNAYTSIGRLDKLLAFRKEQVQKDPQNLEAYLSLSATYLDVGERSKAVAEIERAIELFPEFKERGEFFIREIKAGRNP